MMIAGIGYDPFLKASPESSTGSHHPIKERKDGKEN
jgi:hypothetical protein